MSLLSAPLSPARLYGSLLALVLFIAVATFAGCEHRSAAAARIERAKALADVVSVTDANHSQQQTIETMQRALNEWRALGVTPAEAAEAVTQVDQVHELAAQLQGEIEKAKEREHAKPDCAAWLDSDFERACPDVARRLRDAAAGAHRQDGDGRGAGTGDEAARPKAHR